jgi:hypothetical protein
MDERTWEELLSTALAILDDPGAEGVGAPDIVVGGGTVLMMRMHHRLSRDTDLFLHDAQWLGRLTPRLNDRVAARARDYSEQANSLKLVMPEGDIDFIVAGSVTGAAPSQRLEFRGRQILLDTTEEILAKKLFFRATPSISSRPRKLFRTPPGRRSRPPRRAERHEANRLRASPLGAGSDIARHRSNE